MPSSGEPRIRVGLEMSKLTAAPGRIIRNSSLWSILLALGLIAPTGQASDESNSPIRAADPAYGITTWKSEQGLPQNRVDCLLQTRDGYMWIGTRSGLARFDGVRFTHYNQASTPALVEDSCKVLAEDAEGNLWIGTRTGIVIRQQGRWMRYTTDQGLCDNDITAFCFSSGGGTWIGTAGGVSLFRDGTFINYVSASPYKHVYSLLEDSAGELRVGFSEGLNRLDLATGELTLVWQSKGELPRAHFDAPNCIHEDSQHRLWLGTNHGLYFLTNGSVERFGIGEGLAEEEVRSIVEDRAGTLWIIAGSELHRIENRTLYSLGLRDRLGQVPLRCLFEDREGNLWVGTSYGGLACVRGQQLTTLSVKDGLGRRKDGRFARFTTNQGLSDNLVNQIVEDDLGYLWLGSNHGLSRVSRRELKDVADGRAASVNSIKFTEADGMLSSQCNGGVQPAGCKTRDGKLWFPTARGVVVIDPAKIRTNTRPPDVLIELVRANDEIIFDSGNPASTTRERSSHSSFPQTKVELRLPAGSAQVLDFHFTATSLTAPEKMRFKYRLEGFDSEWRETAGGQPREAHYTNLRPGRYRFAVQASNNHGVWNERGASLAIYLAPYYWQTVWFGPLSGSAFIGVVFAGAWWRFERLKRRKELEQRLAIAEQRTRIADDLHDELGANLSSLVPQGDLLDGIPGTVQPGKLSGQLRECLFALDQVVWLLQPSNDSLERFATYLHRFANRLFDQTPFQQEWDVPTEWPAMS